MDEADRIAEIARLKRELGVAQHAKDRVEFDNKKDLEEDLAKERAQIEYERRQVELGLVTPPPVPPPPRSAASSATYVGNEEDFDEVIDPPFAKGYQPPGRLVLFELIAFALLVYLLMGTPGNGSLAAISSDGKGGVGLLKSCTGATCTSWLGAAKGSGAKTTAASTGSGSGSGDGGVAESLAIGTRDLLPRQLLGDTAGGSITADSTTSAAAGGTGGGAKSTTDPATFHLTTGLAALCLFYTLGLALFFHLWRWWSAFPPPPPDEDPDDDEDDDPENMVSDGKGGFKKKRWYRRKGQKLNGVKRFGYRVSRAFTVLNPCLLAGVMFGSIMMASSSGFGNGTALIIIALVLLVLVAWIEHLGAKGMIGRILLKGQGRLYVPKRNKLVEAQDVAIKV